MNLRITCKNCGQELEAEVAHLSGNCILVAPHQCETEEEKKPIRAYWSDLVKKLEGRTVELHYYRTDGGYREFDCLLYAGGENGKVYIFDQDAQTIKSLVKKNICSVFDYTDDVEYQVIGGLY